MDSVEDTIVATVARLAETPGMDGLLLVGSTATGTRRPNSDIDIVVLIADDADWPKPFRDGGREVFFDSASRQIEVSYTTIRRACEVMRAEALAGRPWRAESFAHSRAVGTCGERSLALVAEARTILDAGPPTIDDGERRWLCFEAWNHRKDAEDHQDDPATANLLANAAFDTMTRLLFWMENRWQPHPKGLLPALADSGPEFHALADAFLTSGDPAARLPTLRRMEDHFKARFGLEFEAPYTSPPLRQDEGADARARATLTP